MPFPFSAICDLLQSLENDLRRKRHQKGSKQIVNDWFTKHQNRLDRGVDRVALLSTLLPERRTDRVFNIKQKRLESIVIKACGLGHSRIEQLRKWETEGAGVDLAECVEEILKAAPNILEQDVTIEEIDSMLHNLAACVIFSSPAVRSSLQLRSTHVSSAKKIDDTLVNLFRKLTARDAKWFSRLILKSLLPVVVPEHIVYSRCHRLLPTVMKIHDDFTVAVRLLEQQYHYSHILDPVVDMSDLLCLIKPQIGVKVGRQTWVKARSIKHCIEMGRGLMSCEKKIDGEYCQIHIDLSKGERNCLQIVSKSGKDSTVDRIKLHAAIKSSLRLGTSSCKFKKRCILEGEMVVYSNIEKKIMGFDKIRKHVKRSGRFIGTDLDSQPHDWEQLMIIYFDVLLIDDDSLLNMRHLERRRRLSALVQSQEGQSALVQSQIINFSSRIATTELRETFASCIVNKDEGLVLKADEPYFSFGLGRRRYASCCLKLKKGYIKNCGDIGDFAVVGARYDTTKAKVLGLSNIKYTHFYLGCLMNKEDVVRFGAKAKFKFMHYVFPIPVPPEENGVFDLDVPSGGFQGKRIPTVFKDPPVFEVTCFSFHRGGNTDFWSLKFPYVSKIHSDRSWKDCLSFADLQELAEEETVTLGKDDRQELAQWIKILEDADPKRRQESTGTVLNITHTQETPSQPSVHESLDKSSATRGIAIASASTEIMVRQTSPESQPPEGPFPARKTPNVGSSCKRQREELSLSPCHSKRPKGSAYPTPAVASHSSQQTWRQPLEDVMTTSSSQGNKLPLSQPCSAELKTFHEQSEAENIEPGPLPPSLPGFISSHSTTGISTSTKSPSKGPLSSTPLLFSDTTVHKSICHHAGKLCLLANHLVLLSPCVANMPWLTEDLLPSHSVTAVFTDIPSWLGSSSFPAKVCPKQRRVVLVERRRTEATKEFLKKLRTESLRRQSGEPEVVIAYDWRVLEAITDGEKAKAGGEGTAMRRKFGTRAHAKEVWQRHYVGLC